MRTGFEVTLPAPAAAKFSLFSPQAAESSELSLVNFARDSLTGTAAVLMGRIYYQEDLKARLPQEMRQDLSSEVALVLAIFEHYGAKGLEWLEGEFALVIFAPEQHCLYALRDPLGNYPLYWTSDGTSVSVSTNLKFLAQRRSPTVINRDFLASFLMFPYAFVELATEQTAFEGVRRILPGTIMALYPDGCGKQIWLWDWTAKITPEAKTTPEEVGLKFNHIFRQGIQERISRGKVAAHLSGGMDSSSVVCIARQLLAEANTSEKLQTLSLVYQMPSLAGETDYIQMVVNQGGAIEPHYVDGDKALDFQWFTEEMPDHDEPYPGLFHLAMEKVLMDRATNLNVTTILSGTGAELVAEGNHMYLADLILKGLWLAALADARKYAHAKNLSPWSVLQRRAIEPLMPGIVREGMGTLARGGYGTWPKLGSFRIPPWIRSDFAREYGMWHKALITIRQNRQYPVEQSFNLLGLRTAAGDWASWYLGAPKGIQISHPFLDPRLIVYCLGLPRELREIPGKSKPLLHLAMDKILPQPILTRRFKGNFNDVYWQGLSQNLIHLENMVEQSKIDKLGIFDKQQLIRAMRQHANGIGDIKSGSRISISLAAIAWFDKIENTESQ